MVTLYGTVLDEESNTMFPCRVCPLPMISTSLEMFRVPVTSVASLTTPPRAILAFSSSVVSPTTAVTTHSDWVIISWVLTSFILTTRVPDIAWLNLMRK